MRGRYTQYIGKAGRKRKFYTKHQKRLDDRRDNARARMNKGGSRTMVISTWENTDEWRWWSSLGQNKSKRAREFIRKRMHMDQDEIIAGLTKSLRARIREIECRDMEILHLRHALGQHCDAPHPDCEACAQWGGLQ